MSGAAGGAPNSLSRKECSWKSASPRMLSRKTIRGSSGGRGQTNGPAGPRGAGVAHPHTPAMRAAMSNNVRRLVILRPPSPREKLWIENGWLALFPDDFSRRPILPYCADHINFILNEHNNGEKYNFIKKKHKSLLRKPDFRHPERSEGILNML